MGPTKALAPHQIRNFKLGGFDEATECKDPAAKETSMGFSELEEESLPLGHSFGDGDDWGMGVGWERNSLFALEDFLLDDPVVDDDHLPEAEPEKVPGMEPQEDVAAISVQGCKSKYAYSCSSTAAAAAASFGKAAVTPPLPLSEITLPEHDAAELEWVSRMTDDSQSEMPAYHHHQLLLPAKPPSPPPAAAAIVYTNNSSTDRRARPVDDAVSPVKAKRSKRARSLMSVSSSSSWSRRQEKGGHPHGGAGDDGGHSVTSNSSSSATAATSSATTATTTTCSSYSSASSSSRLMFAHQLFDETPVSFTLPPLPHPPYSMTHVRQQRAEAKPNRRGRKPKAPHLAGEARRGSKASNNPGGGERRCGHCGVNKTPQWRTGPLGAKTLCNACGVRYKSGRLLPEYRPACSPTFISHEHSNSHRKVLEMRRKKLEEEEDDDEPQEPRRQQPLPVSF